jgi:hypothetical protein
MVYEMKTRIYILLALIGLTATSCHLNFINCLDGSGEIIRESREVKNFDKINLNGGFDISLKQGDSISLIVETDDNLVKYVRTNVDERELEITETKSICTRVKKIYLTVPNLKKITINGAGEIIAKSPVHYNYLEIEGNGASSVRFEELNCPNLAIDISGAGDIRVNKGRGGNLAIRASGAADVKMKDFQTDSSKVEISGAGDVQLWVDTFLLVKVFGAGDVKYKSNQNTKVVKKVMGAGSVTKIE